MHHSLEFATRKECLEKQNGKLEILLLRVIVKGEKRRRKRGRKGETKINGGEIREITDKEQN